MPMHRQERTNESPQARAFREVATCQQCGGRLDIVDYMERGVETPVCRHCAPTNEPRRSSA